MDIKSEIKNNLDRHKMLLAHLPYWVPLIPPMGLAFIKGFLQEYGCRVKAVDLNIENDFKELYDSYFRVFEKYVPADKRGNFYHIGHDVLQQHMMAHINYTDETEYIQLVKILIDTVFFSNACKEQVLEHIEIVREFYLLLENYFVKLFQEEKPTVLGLTVYKGTMAPALFVFKLAKKCVPGIQTVMGGGVFVTTLVAGTTDMENFLERTQDYIDKIMIGKGEVFMLKLLRDDLPASQRVFTAKDVFAGEVDIFPTNLPDLSDFALHNYPYITSSASNGCLHNCSFCNSSTFYGRYRQRPIQHTVREMIELYETYQRRLFFMTDALLNPIIGELAYTVNQSGHALYYDGYFRVDEASCDLENTMKWRQGGFYRARLGVETGSQRLLDIMGKNITVEQTRAALGGLAYAGIKPTAYFVVGHPGETEEDFQMTLDLIEEIKNDIWQAECSPFYYYPSQPGEDNWREKKSALYPENAEEILMMQTWIVDGEPSREVLCNRVARFAHHCKMLGIPNPYSLKEIHDADERWKKLHDNAVPPLVELMNADHLYLENKELKLLQFAQNNQNYDSDFGF